MPRPFLETFGQVRNGKLMEECAAELEEIVKAVVATGKVGGLTIKLKVKPPKAGGISYLMIEDQLVSSVPGLDHGDTVFFHTKDGALSRQDPTQQELFAPRPVRIDPPPAGEVQVAPAARIVGVDTSTGEIKPIGA